MIGSSSRTVTAGRRTQDGRESSVVRLGGELRRIQREHALPVLGLAVPTAMTRAQLWYRASSAWRAPSDPGPKLFSLPLRDGEGEAAWDLFARRQRQRDTANISLYWPSKYPGGERLRWPVLLRDVDLDWQEWHAEASVLPADHDEHLVRALVKRKKGGTVRGPSASSGSTKYSMSRSSSSSSSLGCGSAGGGGGSSAGIRTCR